MKQNKIVAFLLAAQMVLLCASCGQNGGETAETTGAQPNETGSKQTDDSTEPAETKLDRTTVSDDLPEISFNGQDFRFIVNGDSMFQLVTEDYTGVATNDVIYDRNKRVEGRFDVKISAVKSGGESQDTVYQYVMVDEHVAEVLDCWNRMGLSLPPDSFVLNWLDIPYMNWDKPWWNKEANESGIHHGKMFSITGDLAVNAMQLTWAIAFNMELMKDYGGYDSDELYQLVLDGEWTLDKFIEVGSSIYNDTNGDGIENSGDIFGYAAFIGTGGGGYPRVRAARSMPWVHAIGENAFSYNEDHTGGVISLGTEKVYIALDKLIDFHYNTTGTIGYVNDEDGLTALTDFMDGTVAMMPTTFRSCFTDFVDLDFSYGMLPYPKYDTAQESYYTVPEYDFSIYQLPCTLPLEDYELVGVVMEAMGAESWKTVSPTYYDEAMKGRYSADEMTAKMIDLIMDSRIFDWCYQVCIHASGLAKTPYLFSYQLAANDVELASALAEHMDVAQDALTRCIAFYSDEWVNPYGPNS